MNLPLAAIPIHRAAMLASKVPGISLVVYQTDWPPLLVSDRPRAATRGEVWIRVSPRQFRDEVCRAVVETSFVVGPSLGADGDGAHIDIVTDEPVSIDSSGLFSVRDDGHCTVGFVSLLEEFDPPPPIDEMTTNALDKLARIAPIDPAIAGEVEVAIALDAELGTQLVTWRFVNDDVVLAAQVQCLAVDAALSMAVDEIVDAARAA